MTKPALNIPGVKMSRLSQAHIPAILELMNKEGWTYYDAHELGRYLDLNQDCFSLLKGDRIVGSLFTTNYGRQAWIGNIIVAENCRGTGLASAMIRAVMEYLHRRKGISAFRLGSVPLAIGLYKKAGFRPEGFTTAQEANLPILTEPEVLAPVSSLRIETIGEPDLDAVAELDRRYFKSDRRRLLAALFEDSLREGCLSLKDRGKLAGYLMIRRRKASKLQGGFAHGPDHVYRLGPSCVLPEYGMTGFKALFQTAIRAVNREVRELGGSAKIYAVFPRNACREEIYGDTRNLAEAMGMDADLDRTFDRHDLIFGAEKSFKNEAQWAYMERLGFHQEYFEQTMSCSAGGDGNTREPDLGTEATRADTEGIFASATPGDKA